MFEQFLVASSLWITEVPIAAKYSNACLSGVHVGLDTWIAPDVWSVPIYSAPESASLRPLLYNASAWSMVASGKWRRSGNSVAIESTIKKSSKNDFPYQGNVYSTISATSWKLPASYNKTVNPTRSPAKFRVAGGSVPAPGPDGHMAVRQPDGRVFETYGTIVLSSGEIVALSYAVSNPNSRGDGWQNGQTASMLPSYLGVTDDTEIAGGDIGHAMAVTVPAPLLATRIQYPAYAFDRGALTERPPYAGCLPMGARLALPPTIDPKKLHLATVEGLAIAKAARRYGFIVVDRGGGGISLRIRRNAKNADPVLHRWDWRLQQDLATIFGYLKMVQ